MEYQPQDNSIQYAPPPRKSVGWTVTAVIALTLAIAAGILLTFFIIKSGEDGKRIASLEDKVTILEGSTSGEDNGDDGDTGNAPVTDAAIDINLAGLYNAFPASISNNNGILVDLKNSYIKPSTDGNYEIAGLSSTTSKEGLPDSIGFSGTITGGFFAYFYRALPSGTWTYSAFNGHEAPACTDVTDAEKAAFAGLKECVN